MNHADHLKLVMLGVIVGGIPIFGMGITVGSAIQQEKDKPAVVQVQSNGQTVRCRQVDTHTWACP